MNTIVAPDTLGSEAGAIIETRNTAPSSAPRGFSAARNRRRVEPVVRRLNAILALSGAEILAVERLADHTEHHRPGTELFAEGAARPPWVLFSGWACRQRLLPDGRRQIFDFVLPGDIVGFCDRPGPFDATSVLALTSLEMANAAQLRTAALDPAAHPALAAVLANAPCEDQARLLDHVIRLGRLSGYERVGHLLLELRDRLRVAGLGDAERFPLPVTQECLADALGLSVVHVNRVLQQLRRERLIELQAGQMSVLDLAALTAASQMEGRRS